MREAFFRRTTRNITQKNGKPEIFEVIFMFFLLVLDGMTSMMHICAGMVGPEIRNKGLCARDTHLCNVFSSSNGGP